MIEAKHIEELCWFTQDLSEDNLKKWFDPDTAEYFWRIYNLSERSILRMWSKLDMAYRRVLVEGINKRNEASR